MDGTWDGKNRTLHVIPRVFVSSIHRSLRYSPRFTVLGILWGVLNRGTRKWPLVFLMVMQQPHQGVQHFCMPLRYIWEVNLIEWTFDINVSLSSCNQWSPTQASGRRVINYCHRQSFVIVCSSKRDHISQEVHLSMQCLRLRHWVLLARSIMQLYPSRLHWGALTLLQHNRPFCRELMMNRQ